ncbi:CoA transferase [Novosphingobium colocasiae]
MDNVPTFGALSDLKIIDLTQMLAGPYGTMILADHGATVIKVESSVGDLSRAGQYRDDDTQRVLGGYFSKHQSQQVEYLYRPENGARSGGAQGTGARR